MNLSFTISVRLVSELLCARYGERSEGVAMGYWTKICTFLIPSLNL